MYVCTYIYAPPPPPALMFLSLAPPALPLPPTPVLRTQIGKE